MPWPGYNLARFDLVSIRLAVLCAQTGSLTTAARQCNLVLPAASRRIKELESALGCALFLRHSRGLDVTPAGRIFMRRGLAMLQEMESLGAELQDLQQGVVRHVRLFAGTAAIHQQLVFRPVPGLGRADCGGAISSAFSRASPWGLLSSQYRCACPPPVLPTGAQTMKVQLTRDCKIEGKAYRCGDKAELPDDLARAMEGSGRRQKPLRDVFEEIADRKSVV